MIGWEDLDAPWRACLQLAWEAYGANTIPVGAVLTDAHGTIVARGRNRVYERDAAPGELSYSLLAHAEINALVGLPPDRYYDDHTLYTTLEPCALCVGATAVATVGTLRFAGADPYGGGHRPAGANPQLTRAPLVIEGPLENAFGALAAALLPALLPAFQAGRTRRPRLRRAHARGRATPG